ncbi:MAG: hypothetical protein KatS3mg056_3175 [Chloroflexus sp.]|nr:MAG: hypothetical protein KatS3mg056_3175 [Chloroflexus sp.]
MVYQSRDPVTQNGFFPARWCGLRLTARGYMAA